MRYEMIREIFNKCSGNQMRDVFVSLVETEDPEAYIKNMLAGDFEVFEKTETKDGVVFDVVMSGLRQRFSFSEDQK